MNYQRSTILAAACAYALSIASMSNAQTADPKKQGSTVLEEIVVTAEKRAENLQEVPIAITAITAETRDIIGITNIEDMTNFIPGFTYNGALDRATIRGIGRTTNAVGSDPGVALYVDGFYSASLAQAGRTTLFNDRIDVLRGPQGTLYGRNSMAGAINTTSRRPKSEFGAELRTSVGDYGRLNVEGTATGPIADWLRYRVSVGTYTQRGGYFENISGGPDEGGVGDTQTYEVSFAGDIGQSADFLLKWEKGQYDRRGRSTASFTPYATNKCPAPSATQVTACSANNLLLTTTGAYGFYASSGPSALYNEAVNRTGAGIGTVVLNPAIGQYTVQNPATPSNPRQFNTNTPSNQRLDDNNTVVGHLTWHFENFDIKYIGGWQEYLYTQYSDFDNSDRNHYVYVPGGPGAPNYANQVPIYNTAILKYQEDKAYFSNEINVTSTGDGPLQWIAGLYQYKEGYTQNPGQVYNPDQVELRTVYQRPASASAMPPDVLSDPNPMGAFNHPEAHVDVRSRAAFGQLDWQFLDAWEATLGARYSEDEKEGWEKRRNIVWDPTVFGSTARAYDNSPPNYCYAADEDNNAAGISNTRLLENGQLAPTVATLGVLTTGTPSSCRERFVEARQWSDWSGRAGVRWNVTDTTNAFVTYSRGYKAGAIRIGGFEVDVDSKPETLNAYEVGLKTELFDRKLRLNTAAYYYDFMDYQIPLTRVDEANPGRTITDYFNIPKVETYGVEIESTWLVTDALTLNINYGYIGGSIKSDLLLSDALDTQGTTALSAGDTCYYLVAGQPPTTTRPTATATCYQNAKGSPLNNSPENKASFNAIYTWRLTPGNLSVSASYNWRSKISTQLIDRDYYKTDAYGTTSARAIWRDADNRYSIIAHVENLLDEDTYNSVSATSLNGEIVKQYTLNPPRTMGIDFQFRFGSER